MSNSRAAARPTGFVALLLSAVLALAAADDAPRAAIARGNEHYAAGRYEQALQEYASVEEAADVLAEALHNRAAALYKLGRLDDARELWVRAAALRDPAFEGAARYNLGTCDYSEALKLADAGDLTTALERRGRAADQFRDAIRLDPTLTDARANLELALRAAQQLRQQAESQSESQPSQDGQPQSQPSSQPDSAQSQPTSQPDESDGQQQDSQGQSQSGESDSQDGDESSQEPPAQPQDESEAQSQPSQQPQADSQPQESQAASQPQSEEAPVAESQLADVQLSPEQAERLMQMIRDLESKRREYLRLRDARRYRPVERDW